MIRVTILPERDRDRPGAMLTDEVDRRSDERRRFGDGAVGPFQILAKACAEHVPRGRRFCPALLDGAVARKLAFREIAQTDLMSCGGVTRDRAAQANLDIVGVRTEDEQIDRHSSRISSVPGSHFARSLS